VQHICPEIVGEDGPLSASWTRDLARADEIKQQGEFHFKHKFKVPPFEHQRLALAFTLALNRCALFAETGTGKTYVALNNIEIRLNRGRIREALVIAPSSILKVGWFDDARNLSNLKAIVVHKAQGKLMSTCQVCGKAFHRMSKTHVKKCGKYKSLESYFNEFGLPLGEEWRRRKTLREKLEPGFDLYITNPETIAQNRELFEKRRFDMVVLDESTMIKNPGSKRSKAIISCGDKAKYTLALTGTPRGNHLYDLWAQMRFVDGSLGLSYDKFLRRYFWQPNVKNFPMMWKPRSSSDAKIQKKIESRVLTIKKQDCLDLPDRLTVVRRPTMQAASRRHYERLVEDGYTLIENNEVTPSTARAEMLKLIQVSGGFCIGDDGDKLSITRRPAKLEALMQIVNSTSQKVVVWAHFKEDFARLKEALGDRCVTLNGDTSSASIPRLVAHFKDPQGAQVMVAHAQSAKFGHTWTWATICVYYSFMDTVEDYMQSRDRIYRIGQTQKVTEYALLGSPIEEKVWEGLSSGADMSSAFISADSFRAMLDSVGSCDEYGKI